MAQVMVVDADWDCDVVFIDRDTSEELSVVVVGSRFECIGGSNKLIFTLDIEHVDVTGIEYRVPLDKFPVFWEFI